VWNEILSSESLMAPLFEHPTVPEAATLLEAAKTLRKAQDEFGRNRYQHQAILVFDGNNPFDPRKRRGMQAPAAQ